MYKTEDYGLLIGLTTMPFGREKDFIEYEINSIFETHRENVKQACSDQEEPGEAMQFERSLYKPKIYGIFGSFDLAVFALVDDFSLATRYFHPFSPFIEKKIKEKKRDYSPYNFAFHVISGVCPDLSGIDAKEQRLTDRFAPILEAEAIKKYPLMGMTSLKVNNSLLVGTGGKLIDLILRKIQAILAKHQKKQGDFAYLINHSFSWHELTITFFSNNYKIIKDIVFELRALTFHDLSGVASQFNITPLFERIKDDCLLSEQLKDERAEDRTQYIENAHLFVHTNTIFGYDLDLLLKYPEAPIPEEKDFGLYVKWDIKPGHLSAFIKDLNEAVKKAGIEINLDKAKITAGKGDYALQLEQNSIGLFLQLMDAIKTHKLMGHVRKMATVPEFSTVIQEPERYVSLEKHYLFHDELGAYSFDAQVISEARAELKALMVPKIIRERVTNMFVMYNDGIHDPVLFGYFIELRAFLNEVLDLIKSFRSQQIVMVATIVRQMEKVIQIFEHGYKNRFGQSYLMNEITDYNIEFKGGIQQLISAYDGAYKSQTALLGERIGRSVAYVAGDPNTLSDILSVGLNYFHLFQPELFATAATHEASHFLIERLEGSREEGEELRRMIDLHKKLIAQHKKEDGDVPINQAIQYFLTDITTLYIGFNSNFEQFFYWHWVYFLQWLGSYQVNGKIHKVIMEGFMARMLLIDYYFHNGQNCFFDGKILPPFADDPPASLIEAWEYAIVNLNGRIKSLFEDYPKDEDHLAYFRCANDYVLGLILDEFIEGAKYNEKLIKEVKVTIRKEDRAFYDQIDDYLSDNQPKKNNNTEGEKPSKAFIRQARKEYLDLITSKIKTSFKAGEAFSFHEFRERAALQHVRSSFFYQALFNAYLQLIQDLCDNQCKIKDRSSLQANPMLTRSHSTSINLEVDPLGGMFSSSLSCRRKYYQYRILFLKSLWNLSTINKKALFSREA